MTWRTGGGSRTSTADHQGRRRRILARDQHRCQIRGPHCLGRATICDHIRNVASFTNPADAERDDNCQATCQPCHDTKTAAEAAEGRRRRAARRRLPTAKHPGLR